MRKGSTWVANAFLVLAGVAPLQAHEPKQTPVFVSGPGQDGYPRHPTLRETIPSARRSLNGPDGGSRDARKRRILYNLDGDSCLFLKRGSRDPERITADDLKATVHEITRPGSQVDTLLVCVNAQVMYYPTRVGTLRGTDCTPLERRKWPPSEQQRFRNSQALFDAGIDPYAVLLAEAKKRGLEALLTFRVNDAHGNDFLRTAFWREHPEYRLGKGALDFKHEAVREYVFRLIEEAVRRYDCDGLELDFQRFPTFFRDGTSQERVAKINRLLQRIRQLLDAEGKKRGRRLVLGVRIPSDYGRSAPSYATARSLGCDPVAWGQNGWVDFLTVSEFLHVRYDLPIRPWKKLIPGVPIYGSIESAEGGRRDQCLTPEKYRRAARHLWADGADGIYLFNFFTTREWGKDAFEPPFEVLKDIGAPARAKGEGKPRDNTVLPGAGRKHLANPVLTPGPAAWEAGNVLHCSIVRDDKGYQLYYTGEAAPGYAFRSIGVALSTDGVHWKKYAGNPLIAPSRDIKSDVFDNVHCHLPTVVYRREGKPRYRMWYSGYQNNGGNRIGYAHSDDGLHWVRHPRPVLGYGQPGDFDDGGLRSPNVIIHPETGAYWMYYNGTRPGQHYGPTGLAVSRDGIHWEKRGKLSADESRLLYGEVVYDTKARRFRMWHDRGPAITYAESPDGVHWQDLDGPPLLQPDNPYDRGYCQGPSVIYQAESKSYFVYYNGAAAGYPASERVTINLAVFPAAGLERLRLRPAR